MTLSLSHLHPGSGVVLDCIHSRSLPSFLLLKLSSCRANSKATPILRSQTSQFAVADLFLFCYESDFMMSLSDDKQPNIIDSFNTTSRYLDGISIINNVYFDNILSK